MEGLFRRRHLPHIDVEDKPYFITGCLAGSFSAIGMKQINAYRDALDERPIPQGQSQTEWTHHKHKLMFKLVDSLLDGESPVRYLDNDQAAEIVQWRRLGRDPALNVHSDCWVTLSLATAYETEYKYATSLHSNESSAPLNQRG